MTLTPICPRCGEGPMHPETAMNALSRRDNDTYICSPCGGREAMQDLGRHSQVEKALSMIEELAAWSNPPSGIRNQLFQMRRAAQQAQLKELEEQA
jgi:hypothetical protein